MVILSSSTAPVWEPMADGADRAVEYVSNPPTFHASVIHSRTGLSPLSSEEYMATMAVRVRGHDLWRTNRLDTEGEIESGLLHNGLRHNRPSNVQVLMRTVALTWHWAPFRLAASQRKRPSW